MVSGGPPEELVAAAGSPERPAGTQSTLPWMDDTVGEIAGLADPVLRNLCITQRYHEFAVALRDAGCGDDATWCAFAVWASKTAGATIRGEVLPGRAKDLLNEDSTQDALQQTNHGLASRAMQELTRHHLGRVIEDVTGDVSSQIAAGNALVFGELAPIFTALVRGLGSEPVTQATLAATMAPALAALGTDPDAATVGAAFDGYGRAPFAGEGRAALVLEANILAVAHEQRRLQPAISGALNAAISDTLKKLIETEVVRHVPGEDARRTLDEVADGLCSVLDQAWDTALTESIMRLVTPGETFDLRQDVPPLPDGMFPLGLRALSETPAGACYTEWDKSGGTGNPSGAQDWAELGERMNFIVNLFRSRQQDANLFEPPFSPAQLAVLQQGQLPPGPL
jgi:hypothetical protein